MLNKQEPLRVSIQCLVYNHEPYLRQCLDGFVMQKTNFKFEAIVHDDVSTDGSAAIIREYAEKYPDIIKPIFEIENQYSKRDGSLERIMYEACRGKYIAICEGDDYWIDPFKLQKQVDFMDANLEYSLVCSAGKVLTSDGFITKGIIGKATELFPKDLILGFWGYIPTASIMYRKHILEDYPEFCRTCFVGDRPLKLFCVLNGKVYYFNQEQVVYRYNDKDGDSWSARFSKDNSMQLMHHESLAQLEYELDEYSDRKFHKYFSRMRAVRVLETVGIDPKQARKVLFRMQKLVPEYKDFLTQDERIKLFIIINFPKFTILLRRIKSQIQRIVVSD